SGSVKAELTGSITVEAGGDLDVEGELTLDGTVTLTDSTAALNGHCDVRDGASLTLNGDTTGSAATVNGTLDVAIYGTVTTDHSRLDVTGAFDPSGTLPLDAGALGVGGDLPLNGTALIAGSGTVCATPAAAAGTDITDFAVYGPNDLVVRRSVSLTGGTLTPTAFLVISPHGSFDGWGVLGPASALPTPPPILVTGDVSLQGGTISPLWYLSIEG